ncbi:hypothetical protein H0H81_007751 [Sphagnurus paluster]|uniref:Uncharacterized protein n=1 Tax=Sphagnurus paluster TaxID=117069 RepID=A0A9P7FR99_9AGAR|nr:hypothetical protein H0H81_007751 [Sphagnurus paluster]
MVKPSAGLQSPALATPTWMVGCNLLLTAVKVCNDCGLSTNAYTAIVDNTLFTISTFSQVGVTIILYQPAACLQIKEIPATNHPIKLTSVFQTLDILGIFKGIELIKNGPAPSDTLSWARDPKSFTAKSCPCAVMVCFYNNDE